MLTILGLTGPLYYALWVTDMTNLLLVIMQMHFWEAWKYNTIFNGDSCVIIYIFKNICTKIFKDLKYKVFKFFSWKNSRYY